MKRAFILFFAAATVIAGCRTKDASMEPRASIDQQVPQTEPYSKTQIETVQEPAGASSQTERGVKNPFLYPRTGPSQILPQNPMPPQRP